jgi:RND family efflux transporter MFP subunit
MLTIKRCLLLVPAALLLFGGCSREQAAPEPVIRPVRFQQVYSTGAARARTFSGVARADVEANLSFKVPGTVDRIAVEVGKTVKVGDLIAELDAGDYQLQVEDAEASLVQATAQRRNASAEYERTRELYTSKNASKQDLDQARAAYESATANVESIEKKLELARRQLDYTRLTAPIAGAIAARNVEINENVQAGQTVVLLTSDSDLEVSVGIPEVLISQVREGEEATVRFDAFPGREFPARITEVGVAATGTATTFPLTVRLGESNPDIRSGMAANVTIQFEAQTTRDLFIVPYVSVGEDRQGRFVFVLEKTEPGFGVAHRREVRIGELTGTGIEILDGIADGDLIVTAGVSRIHDGQKVKLPRAEEAQR